MSRFTTLIVLLGGIAILLLGNGLFGTLLGVRANLEGFDIATTGFVMSAYFLGFVLGSFYCVRAVVRVGHIRTFAALSATLAATAIAHAMFPAPAVWGLLRLAAGFCVVGIFLVVESWLNSMTPPHLRGRVFSIYMMVNLLAMAIGQFLLTLAPPGDFVLFGLVSMLFALSLLPTTLARIDAPPPQTPGGLNLGELYGASPLGVTGCFACGVVTGAFWGMGPVFGSKSGFDAAAVATFMSTIIIGGLLAQWPVGMLSDRVDRRKIIVAVAAAGSASALAIAALAAGPFYPVLAGAAVFGGSMFSLYSLSVARTLDVVGPEKVLDATRALILVFGIGAVIGPMAAGWAMDALAPFAMFALIALIFGLLAAYGLYRRPLGETVPVEEQTAFVPLLRTSHQGIELAEEPNTPN